MATTTPANAAAQSDADETIGFHQTDTPLFALTREMSDLYALQALAEWDQQTQMPSGASGVRAEQMGALEAVLHERGTAPALGRAIEDAEAALAATPERFTAADRALVREARRDFDQKTKFPADFVRERAAATSAAWSTWQSARANKDFNAFAPSLTHIVDLTRRGAQYLNPNASEPYAVLFDLFEPGMTLATASAALDKLRDATVPLLKRVQAAQQVDNSFLKGNFPTDKQLAFSRELLGVIGYDFTRGRLDTTAHPFATGIGSPYDARLTTRVFEDDLVSCIMSVMHECGHAHYEQGIDPALSRTLLGHGTSSGIHESQSRTWENIIGRSDAFWSAHYAKLQAAFPEPFAHVSVTDFVRAINRAEGSLIRVEADELTYNLHIIIRFEIERDLMAGKINVQDLPDLWNQKYQDYLGVTPPDAGDGVLQDVHWSSGYFGYFPTYSLGNCYAAQFNAKMRQDIPDVDARLAAGETRFILDWQHEHIHRWGTIYQGDDLCRRVTGEGLNPDYLIAYLTEKYERVYGLK
jgi:carboxypeptidase Taq